MEGLGVKSTEPRRRLASSRNRQLSNTIQAKDLVRIQRDESKSRPSSRPPTPGPTPKQRATSLNVSDSRGSIRRGSSHDSKLKLRKEPSLDEEANFKRKSFDVSVLRAPLAEFETGLDPDLSEDGTEDEDEPKGVMDLKVRGKMRRGLSRQDAFQFPMIRRIVHTLRRGFTE